MKKRLKSLTISLILTLALTANVLATDLNSVTDITGHWGESHIRWVLEQGFFNGTSDTTFEPDLIMTRSMFVTVLGRMAGVNSADYQDDYLANLYSDVPVDAWYSPYVNWATRYGITRGTGGTSFSPDMPVSREQVATLLERYASNFGLNITTVPDAFIADSFVDANLISDFAVTAAETMRCTGVLSGRTSGDGIYYFAPQAEANRAECAAVFHRLSLALAQDPNRVPVDPYDIDINMQSVTLKLGESTTLGATVYPDNASNKSITWVSSNPAVAAVDYYGQVTALSEGTADISCYTCNGCYQTCTVTVERNISLAYDGETYSEKCDRIFGTYLSRSEYRNYYSSSTEAKSHMKTITIKAWDFTDSSHTDKYTRTFYLTVHENIADTVQAIFDEIYNGSEQFPIHSVGGYRWDYDSEHTIGVAIDINPTENYYINYKTGQTVGSYWKPHEDPYSIPTDGEVAQIFNKYGFTQGIWSNSADYMHFSYFGW